MKRRIWTLAAALACVAALVAVPAAYAAYTTAKLEVRQAGTSATVKLTLDPNDDPTASVRIFVPAGTTLTTTQAPGTSLGPVRAIVKALDLAGADLPLEGNLVVAAPGQSRRRPRLRASARHASRVLGDGVERGGTDPARSRRISLRPAGPHAALGPAFIRRACRRRTSPAGTPVGRRSARSSYSAELTVNGVFQRVRPARGSRSWSPYRPGVGQINADRQRSLHPPRSRLGASRSLRGGPAGEASAPSSRAASRRAARLGPARPSRSSAARGRTG